MKTKTIKLTVVGSKNDASLIFSKQTLGPKNGREAFGVCIGVETL